MVLACDDPLPPTKPYLTILITSKKLSIHTHKIYQSVPLLRQFHSGVIKFIQKFTHKSLPQLSFFRPGVCKPNQTTVALKHIVDIPGGHTFCSPMTTDDIILGRGTNWHIVIIISDICVAFLHLIHVNTIHKSASYIFPSLHYMNTNECRCILWLGFRDPSDRRHQLWRVYRDGGRVLWHYLGA